MNRRHSILSPIAALTLAVTTPALAQSVTELYVTPDTLRLAAGNRQALTVQAFDQSGNAVLAFAFRSEDSLVAQVATNGSVTAGHAGRTRLTVQAGEQSKSVVVLVTGGAAPAIPTANAAPRSAPVAQEVFARLVAEPASLTLFPGQRQAVSIRALQADGTPLSSQPEVIWRSLQPGIAGLVTPGEITGGVVGQTVVQVVGGDGISVSIPVTVSAANYRLSTSRLILAPDDRDSVIATIPSQGDRPVPAGALQWLAQDPGILEVGPDGQVRALAAGHTDLIIRGFLQERRIPVVVHRRVAHFLVAPRLTEPVRLMLKGTRQFTVLPQTNDSIPIEGVPLAWALSDSSVATFDTLTGILTAHRGGTTTLTFAARGFAPRGWTIEILPGEVSLSAAQVPLRPGEQLSLTATFVDPQGRPVGPASNLAWTTSDASVAKVTPTGEIQAASPGRATITAAAAGGKPASAVVVVSGDLVISSSRGGSFGIYALAASTPDRFIPVVVDSSNNVDPTYSPDRTRLAYASDRAGSLDLYVAEADGSHPLRLTSDAAPESEPAWSPDGRRLVFAATRAGSRQLYVISAAGGESRQLTSLPGGAYEPVISPDGSTVAFTGVARDGQSDIYTIPLAGGVPTAITQTRDRRELNPGYLPSGALTWLVQRKDKKDPDQVLQQPRAGIAGPPLFSSVLAVQDVILSPDGDRIAWVASRTVDGNRAAPEFTLRWRTLSSGAETSVRLLPGERITSPAF